MSFAEPHKLGQRPWNKDAFEALKSPGAPGPAGRLQILAPIRRVQLPEGTIYDLLKSGGRVALVDEAHVEARPSGDGLVAGDAVLGREAVVALPPKSKSSPSPPTTVVASPSADDVVAGQGIDEVTAGSAAESRPHPLSRSASRSRSFP